MRKPDSISKTKSRIIALVLLLLSHSTLIMSQQPTHYPKANEPVPWTLGNILIYIGGPILLFLVYYYYRKREKRKAEEKNKASASAKATTDGGG